YTLSLHDALPISLVFCVFDQRATGLNGHHTVGSVQQRTQALPLANTHTHTHTTHTKNTHQHTHQDTPHHHTHTNTHHHTHPPTHTHTHTHTHCNKLPFGPKTDTRQAKLRLSS